MSDKAIVLKLLQRRSEVSKDAIARAIRSHSVTQRISDLRADGHDIPKPREWKWRGRSMSAYRLNA